MDATKIQLSPTRIIPDAMTVWHEHGPDVDIVMDLKHLTFAPDSIEKIYAFHVLDHMFPSEVEAAIANWYAILKQPSGEIFFVVDDFEFIARSFIGGDLSIDDFNKTYTHPMQFCRDNILGFLKAAGFVENETKVWYVDVPNQFKKREHEMVLSCQKV